MIRSFEGKTPKIADSAYIDEAAIIIGDVEIGENSGVFPGAVIRGDFARIKIGNNTMIEDNSVIHSGEDMEIGDNVTVGHGVVVHGVKIGSHCLVGNNSTILDNSKIGNYCVIAAGALVSTNMEVPDYSMVVGIPGASKPINERMRKRLQGSGQSAYAELVKRYKQG
jgi:carbonic anhydrase/acetyltransferase-like protein (isoleucine patch superfamily)